MKEEKRSIYSIFKPENHLKVNGQRIPAKTTIRKYLTPLATSSLPISIMRGVLRPALIIKTPERPPISLIICAYHQPSVRKLINLESIKYTGTSPAVQPRSVYAASRALL